jgi:hypothetical protein
MATDLKRSEGLRGVKTRCEALNVAITYASHCTSPGRCKTFSVSRSHFDNLAPRLFLEVRVQGLTRPSQIS